MAKSTGEGGKTGGRGFLVLLTGVALGVVGTILLPNLLAPYLPQSLRSSEEAVAGLVTAKERQDDRLLLTVDSPSGAVLATFSKKVAEISLLVDEGDSVTLAVRLAEPFVNDPTIRQVRKASRGQSPPESASAVTEMTTPDTARIQEVIEEPAAELDTIGPSDSTAAETPG
jgi:small basic protein